MFNSIEMKRLLQMANLFLMILVVFMVAATLYTFKSYRNADLNIPINNTVTVTSEGEVFAVPDVATFSFGAMSSAKTVTDAQKNVTDKIAKALALVKGAGVEDKDIKTTDYSVSPRYEYTNFPCGVNICPPSKQNLVGYEVSQNISVKVRKVEDAGKILESLGGTEVTNISGLQFTIDDQNKLEADARAKAITDAKAKAKVLAKDLGLRLVRIVNFSESGNYPIFYGRDASAVMEQGMGGGNPVVPKAEVPVGQNKISSNISITYQIK
jgi:uncharacterized protein YggE